MSRASDQNAADVFFALGDRTRLSVVRKLGSAGALTASRLSEGARVTRQAVVKHLQVLEDAGLVIRTRDGREVFYSLQTRRLEEARDFIDAVSRGWDRAIARLRSMVE